MSKSVWLLAVAGFAFSGVTADEGPFTWGGREAHPAVVNPVVPQDGVNVLSLRGDWEFTTEARVVPKRNGLWGIQYKEPWTKSRTLQVPGCWEAQGVGEPGQSEIWDPTWDNCQKPIRHKFMGEAWYRKTVDVPASWKGKRIWIKFGGIKSCGWVIVNGKQVALVDNYCATEKYDITDLVEPGKPATVVVDVSNLRPSRKGLMSILHRWGSIYRDVELEATPAAAWIDDAWVRGDFDGRKAEVKVEVQGGGGEWWKNLVLRATVEGETVESPICQSDNSVNQTITGITLRNFRPWSPESPNLYTAKVELVSADGTVLQTRYERFGVRKIEVVGKEFRLNGKPFFIRGFGDDFVYPITGMSPADRDVHRAHLRKAREAGFNYVRLHTHCELPEYFEAADELGIMIQAELPYYSDVPAEGFAFDPQRDATELWKNYRRHPSFATYSMGNEGSFGDVLDRRLHQYIKAMDPDRLKINQDVQWTSLTTPDRSDFDGGPVRMWPRGSHKAERPFVAHEYLNLSVKTDSRTADLYDGVWQPPVTRQGRAAWLARFGLDHTWGDRLQDAQHVLQKVWQKRGIECARADVGCGGYIFWTIIDVVVWNKQAETYSAQGLFNPFWQVKSRGATAAEFARFNSPSCVLTDLSPSNEVFTAGERFTANVLFAHFGDAPLADAKVRWALRAGGRDLVAGEKSVGAVALGPVRKLTTVDVTVPSVAKAVKAELVISVGDVSNAWDLWLFPKGPSHDEIVAAAVKKGVVIAASDSPEAKAALEKGAKLITIDGADGKTNVSLGWWYMGKQVGTALKDHPALAGIPHEGALTPLLFRIVKDKGLALPALGLKGDDLIIVGEGGEQCCCYLAERRIGASKVLACHGLDLVSDLPEGNALLAGMVEYLAKGL